MILVFTVTGIYSFFRLVIHLLFNQGECLAESSQGKRNQIRCFAQFDTICTI